MYPIKQCIERYLERKAIYDKGRTIELYRTWLLRFHQLSHKELEKVDFDDILRFTRLLKVRYSEGTVQLVLRILKGYLQFYERRGFHFETEDLRIPRARINSYEPITPDEYVSLLSFIKADTFKGLRDNVIIRLLYDTGARVWELCSLEKEQLDLEDRTAYIWTEKTVEKRLIGWGNDTNVFLKTYLSMNPHPLFPTTRQVERIVTKYVKITGIKKHIVPHSFRHGRAHLILDNGGSVKAVQEILGHLSPTSSFRYLNLNRKEKLKQLDRFLND